ncbi:putative reverse transcriptase domain-containing protein, partial [Tanacetum coccineum]
VVTASVPLSSPIPRALSSTRADLLPSPKRIRSPELATDLEGCSEDSFESYVPREAGLRVDVERSEIDKYVSYADALRARGIDARVVVEAVDREEIEASTKGPVKVRVDRVTHPVIADDIPEPAQEGAVEVTYEALGDLVQRFHDHTVAILVHHVQVIESVQRDQGHMIVAIRQQSTSMLGRIRELERDNKRLRDIVDVASQRVTRSQCRELRVQRELRQIRRFRFYDRIRIARLELVSGGIWATILRLTMPNIQFGASRTRKGVNEQIDRRLTGALGARGAARNLEPLIRDEEIEEMEMEEIKIEKMEMEEMEMVYCPRNEVQKMETELWNLAVKGNDLTAYTRRFQELVLLCTRMVPNEEDKVKRFVGGLPDNIQGNVIAAEPAKL